MKKGILQFCIIFPIIVFLPALLFSQEQLLVRAKIWDYGSICDFADPPHSSGYDIKPTTDKVTFEVTNCKTFDQKHGKPSAVNVTLENREQSAMKVAIDKDLTSVALIDDGNRTFPALAKRAMVEGPMGGKKMEFVTKVEASYLLTLKPGEEINIIYLFSKAKAGDTIKIGSLRSVKIQ